MQLGFARQVQLIGAQYGRSGPRAACRMYQPLDNTTVLPAVLSQHRRG